MRKTIIYLLLLGSCSAGKTINQPPDTVEKQQNPSILFSISQSPEKYINKEITFEGEFLGYGGASCVFPSGFATSSPLTRSDWLVSDGKFCAYISGEIFNGYNPMADKNKPITIQATVQLTKDNKLFLIHTNKQ